jgi:putative zinc-dependent peptidase DUF5700
MLPRHLVLAVAVGLVLTGDAAAAPSHRAGPADDRIDLRLDTSEAEQVLAISTKRANHRPTDGADWQSLFATEPYIRLKKREAEIGKKYNAPELAFTDEQFRQFVMADSLSRHVSDLRRTLDDWKQADLVAAAGRVLGYLPADARIRAKVFPVIKPLSNSFVFETTTDPAIFLHLDPQVARAKFENTVAHELHHIGFASVAARRESLLAGLAPDAHAAIGWVGCFGEGFAMLAAAGGPDVHPHATSTSSERARWDHDLANFDQDLGTVQKFLLDVAQGRLKTDEEQGKVGYAFFGVQGPWYTVGWKMAVVIEKRYGRARLIECMLDLRQLLPTYNRAAQEQNRTGGKHLATWSPELLTALGAARQ